MDREELLNQFAQRLRSAAGNDLVSLVLYGSAADGDFHAGHSDLNLLCVLRDASFEALAKIAPTANWWRKKGQPAPLFLTHQELQDSGDVFSIEFLDMKRRYRVLYGEDVLKDLAVPMDLHRRQLEYELREKMFLLRQRLLVAGRNEKHLWEVMLASLSSFTTLMRHVLVELGQSAPQHSRDAVTELAGRLNFDPSAFVQLMDIRAKQKNRKQFSAANTASQYLGAIEKVAASVDRMQ